VSMTAIGNCYAVRRVNPFVGALHILETPQGRALTVNGVVWELELLTTAASREWGALNRTSSETMHCRYGLWSEADGVIRYPYQFEFDPRTSRRQAEELTTDIRKAAAHLPFALHDSRELWLLDQQNQQPIALLASMTPRNEPTTPLPKYWKASMSRGTPSQQRFPQAGRLEEMVRRRAGFNLERRWIDRQSDGSGIVSDSGEVVAAHAFPPFLLTLEWDDAAQRNIADDFVAWTAPALLTLQQLSARSRELLERRLCVQAQSIEHHWRLYPQLLDENLLKAARVQCRLMGASNNSAAAAGRGGQQHD
jgi:hypothetical protein